jgi:hypothetical protein
MTIPLSIAAINGTIALFGFWMAWQIWQIRGKLARVADTVSQAERKIDRALGVAPSAIERGQLGTQQLRQEYRALTTQQQRIAQVLSLLHAGGRIWRSSRRGRQHTGNRPSSVGKARSR